MEIEYSKNPNWTKQDIKRIARNIDLRESQVYKWHWDQRKSEETLIPPQL